MITCDGCGLTHPSGYDINEDHSWNMAVAQKEQLWGAGIHHLCVTCSDAANKATKELDAVITTLRDKVAADIEAEKVRFYSELFKKGPSGA